MNLLVYYNLDELNTSFKLKIYPLFLVILYKCTLF